MLKVKVLEWERMDQVWLTEEGEGPWEEQEEPLPPELALLSQRSVQGSKRLDLKQALEQLGVTTEAQNKKKLSFRWAQADRQAATSGAAATPSLLEDATSSQCHDDPWMAIL